MVLPHERLPLLLLGLLAMIKVGEKKKKSLKKEIVQRSGITKFG